MNDMDDSIIEKDIKARYRPHLRPGKNMSSGDELIVGLINDGARATVTEINVLSSEIRVGIKTPFVVESGADRRWGMEIPGSQRAVNIPFKLEYLYKDDIDIPYKLIVDYVGPRATVVSNIQVAETNEINPIAIFSEPREPLISNDIHYSPISSRGANISLILGAGASKAISSCFGLGFELLDQIKKEARNYDTSAFNNLLKEKTEISQHVRIQFSELLEKYIHSSDNASIDNFIEEAMIFDEYEEFRELYIYIAHVAIIFHVVEWESKLKRQIETGQIKIEDTWIWEIIRFIEQEDLLARHSNPPMLSRGNLQIITFNYDRIIEYFLLKHFSNSVEIRTWIANNVFHVYGQISDIEQLEFGSNSSNLRELESLTKNIVTINESRKDYRDTRNIILSNQNEIRKGWDVSSALINSSKLIVLGFGFAKDNCLNIGLDKFDREIISSVYYDGNDSNFKKRRYKIVEIKNFNRRIKPNFKSLTNILKIELNYQIIS